MKSEQATRTAVVASGRAQPREIPILRIPFSDEDKDFVAMGVVDVLSSGILTMGPHTAQFEEAFAGHIGAKYCVATSNGTTALELILRALDIQDRSVIVPTNTFFATALAVMHSGNRVQFADSDPNTLCLDPADLRRRITPDTAAVILVHIGGVITPAMPEIRRICDEHGILLIEDCAHAHGCTIDGQSAGTLGVAGAFSFFPTKVLVTGEGGMVSTDDEELYRRALLIRNQGKDPRCGNRITEIGHNFRMSEITAVLGVQQMRNAGHVIEARREIARRYDGLLAGTRLVSLRIAPNVHSAYYKYIAYLPEGYERASVKRILKEEFGISLTGEVYADPCHTEPVWERYAYCGKPRQDGRSGCARWPQCGCGVRQDDFPGTDSLSRRHVCLPLYPGLESEDVAWVVEALNTVLARDPE